MHNSTRFIKNLEKFKLVTFDVTDTILKLKTTPAIQYAKTAAAFGYNNIDQQVLSKCFKKEFKAMSMLHPNFGYNTKNMNWQKWWKELVCNIFRCVDSTIPPGRIEQIAETLLMQYRTCECWETIDCAKELVNRIKEAGKYVGVISNFDPSLELVLEEMEFNSFDFILTSYECGVQKPNKKIFDIPLETFKITSNEALHIGNLYEVDYLGAKRSGWSALLVTNDFRNSGIINQSHICKNMNDVLIMLQTNDIPW